MAECRELDAANQTPVCPSLLAKVPKKRTKEVHKLFKLGRHDWTASSEDSDSDKENEHA